MVRRRSLTSALTLAALVAMSLVASDPTGAQEEPSAGSAPGEQALVAVDVDVLRADNVLVGDTLTDIRENVETQKAMLTEAQTALTNADAALAAADAALADTQARLAAVNTEADRVVVDAFLNPPYENAWEALASDSLMDATVKQSILTREADADAAALEEYGALQDQLEAEQAEREAAAEAADAAAADAETAYADVESAVGQQAIFVAEVQRRLDRNLSEAQALQNTDPELAAQIMAREAELAAALNELDDEVQAQRAQERAAELADQADTVRYQSGIKPVPGGVTDVVCPTGGVVQVAGDIAEHHRAPARRRGRRRLPDVRLRISRSGRADRRAPRQLRHLQLRHLPGPFVVLLAADRPPGHVDARAGPRHRLHVEQRGHDRIGLGRL